MSIDIDEVIDELKNLKNIIKESEKLKAELFTARRLIDEYRSGSQEKAVEHENMKSNFRGMLKQRDDEIDVLYRKLYVILKTKRPADFKGSWAEKEKTQELLDAMEPTNIKIGDKPYMLRYTTRGFFRDPDIYPERQLNFC